MNRTNFGKSQVSLMPQAAQKIRRDIGKKISTKTEPHISKKIF